MYSAVFFGCPVTTISPSRCTSTPTWSMEVASSTSVGYARPAVRFRYSSGFCRQQIQPRRGVQRRVETMLQLREAFRDPAARHPPGQFLHPRTAAPGPDLLRRQPVRHVVLDQAPHPRQFARRGEVVHQRHVRVRGRAVPVEQELPGSSRLSASRISADFSRTPCAQMPQVPPSRRGLRGVTGTCREERVARVQHRRREHRQVPREHLRAPVPAPAARSPSRRRPSAGPDRARQRHSRRRRLVQPDHRAERAGDQVQLVLDDQVRRTQPRRRLADRRGPGHAWRCAGARPARYAVKVVVPVPVPRAPRAHPPEQRPRAAVPGQLRQLVHGGDHQAGQSAGRSPRPR